MTLCGRIQPETMVLSMVLSGSCLHTVTCSLRSETDPIAADLNDAHSVWPQNCHAGAVVPGSSRVKQSDVWGHV